MAGFLWDDANLEHIARHKLDEFDVEEALLDPYGLDVPASIWGGEHRFGFLGATASGRILFVVFTERGGDLRVVTAYDANAGQKRRYRRR